MTVRLVNWAFLEENPTMQVLQFRAVSLIAAILIAIVARVDAADEAKPNRAAYDQAVTKAIDFLRTKGQAADGSYSAPAGPAITAIVTTAILKHGRSPDAPQVPKALTYLEGI